jgi:hypothetical protein
LKIPSSLKILAERSFHECKGFTDINLPSSLESIGSIAFYDCLGLVCELNLQDFHSNNRSNCHRLLKRVYRSAKATNIPTFCSNMGLTKLISKDEALHKSLACMVAEGRVYAQYIKESGC